jgi:hypothetical protein
MTEREYRNRVARLRRAIAKTDHTLHKGRGLSANWSGRPYYIVDYSNTAVGLEMNLPDVEAWLARRAGSTTRPLEPARRCGHALR